MVLYTCLVRGDYDSIGIIPTSEKNFPTFILSLHLALKENTVKRVETLRILAECVYNFPN
jgi:hypothetical protein